MMSILFVIMISLFQATDYYIKHIEERISKGQSPLKLKVMFAYIFTGKADCAKKKRKTNGMDFCTPHANFEKNNRALTFGIMINTCSFCNST